jgi:apolipoprotein N-acyltransferase
VLAFPPPQVRALAWVALAPLLVSIRRAGLLEAVALAGAWGMLGAWGITDWLPPAVARYYQQPLWLGAVLFLTASFVMGAVEYMAFGAFYWWAARHGLRPLALLAAAGWTAAELGRTRLLTGNPWGLLGYTQTGVAPGAPAFGLFAGIAPLELIQIADLGGVYAIGFVLAAFNACLADLWIAARSGTLHGATRETVAVLALVAASFAYGNARLHAADTDAPAVPIAVAQGNLDLGSQWREDLYGANLDVYLALTQEAAGQSPPAIVFWPENAMTFFVDDEPSYRAAVARVTRALDAQLVAGAPRFENREDPVYFNSAFVLSPAGDVTARYDKQQLLPFAEYFPFSSVDLLRRSFARVREFTPGRETAPVATRAGPAAVTICNEAMFPHIVTERVRQGAAYLVNLSNDTWIDSTEFAEQQLGIVSLRAVEQRRTLVRASTSGPSAIVDPAGRIVARTAPLTRSVLRGEIRPAERLTPYARLGDAFAYGCVAVVAVIIAGSAALSKRRSVTTLPRV